MVTSSTWFTTLCISMCDIFSQSDLGFSIFACCFANWKKRSLAQKCFHREELWRYEILEVCVFLKVKNSKTMVSSICSVAIFARPV